MTRRRRIRVPPDALKRDPIVIEGDPLRHLQVLRLQRGDRLSLFDGVGTEIEVELREISARRATAAALGHVESDVEAEFRCAILVAVPVRIRKLDGIVRQLTELGVARIVPVFTEHGRNPSDAARGKLERWRRVAAAAAEQSGRTEVPTIDEPVELTGLDWEGLPRPILLFDPEGTGLASRGTGGNGDEATVAVGPEGGWSEEEIGLLTTRGAERVGLGARVLRSETAAVVASALVMHRLGDLG